ncbi:hypothetical protein SDC9_55009 [bioreactor metagenome]|uniref:Uncharacterized protein n=1 Tax=bioreactor metagenome TaxID=1076179 RepID=A0A644WXQ7_9ZZZZ
MQKVPQGGFQLLPRLGHVNPDGGAAPWRLHHAGHRQLFGQGFHLRLAVLHQPPLGRADTGGFHQPFGDNLIHGHGGGKVSRAGVGDSQQIQSSLNASVLPALAVQPHKHQIRQGADA